MYLHTYTIYTNVCSEYIGILFWRLLFLLLMLVAVVVYYLCKQGFYYILDGIIELHGKKISQCISSMQLVSPLFYFSILIFVCVCVCTHRHTHTHTHTYTHIHILGGIHVEINITTLHNNIYI